MFHDYESSGKHMICDFKGIENIELLNDATELKYLMREICKINDFNILNEIDHLFVPIGCSILFLLSESHLSIHTFPEKKHISFDIYTCRQYNDNAVYNKIYDFLLHRLKASLDSKCRIVDRYF
jgi:S-adenosylmethionine decarboxylase proenzyme